MKTFLKLCSDESGQAMTEYIIVSTATAITMIAFLNSEVLGILPGGIYKGIYHFLRALIINVVIPIP